MSIDQAQAEDHAWLCGIGKAIQDNGSRPGAARGVVGPHIFQLIAVQIQKGDRRSIVHHQRLSSDVSVRVKVLMRRAPLPFLEDAYAPRGDRYATLQQPRGMHRHDVQSF